MLRVLGLEIKTRADDIIINPALPIIRNVPYFPKFKALKAMQDFDHQQ